MAANPQPDKVIFHEAQRMWQWWLWLVTIAMVVAALATTIPMRTEPPDSAGRTWQPYALTAIPAVVATGIVLLFWNIRLVTEVRGNGLFIRYFPFHFRVHEISLDDVASVKAFTYHPIAEYGGWGIRFAWKGKAYNVRGNLGVRIYCADAGIY